MQKSLVIVTTTTANTTCIYTFKHGTKIRI